MPASLVRASDDARLAGDQRLAAHGQRLGELGAEPVAGGDAPQPPRRPRDGVHAQPGPQRELVRPGRRLRYVDVRVDRYFRVFHNNRYPYIDVREPQEDLTELVEVENGTPFILHPGEFVLGSTLERIRLPDDLVARLEGKSSLGRLGLLIHSTAGFIDPGWDGHVTLELSNVANLPVTIYPEMKIGQISFVQLTEAAETPYGTGGIGSKYQGQRGPTPSRYWQNFQKETAG